MRSCVSSRNLKNEEVLGRTDTKKNLPSTVQILISGAKYWAN